MWRFLAGCLVDLSIDEPRVVGDAESTEVSVRVSNDGVRPVWVWNRPSRILPPDDDGVAVMSWVVDGEAPDVICLMFVVPEATLIPPGGAEDLVFDTTGEVPYGEPELACAERDVDCAEALEVEVAWGLRPLDRRVPEHGDPRAIVARRQDGVLTTDWVR